MSGKPGYHGVILNINLSTGKIEKVAVPPADLDRFVGGQGLGMKILWDRLKKPGVNPLSPENPLIFMPDRFFEDAFTIGPKKGAVLDRDSFDAMLTRYYTDRGWDPDITKPGSAKLKELGLDFI